VICHRWIEPRTNLEAFTNDHRPELSPQPSGEPRVLGCGTLICVEEVEIGAAPSVKYFALHSVVKSGVENEKSLTNSAT
jgi:hypothetical protein